MKGFATLAIGLSILVLSTAPADAGCGCQKPPPLPAAIRPAATWAGAEVDLFHASLEVGAAYRVVFSSGTATAVATVDATAAVRRDLADAAAKAVLTVDVPNLPLGPTRVEVLDTNGHSVVVVEDDGFTVAPQPIGVADGLNGTMKDYRAAVGRDHTVYISLDLSGVTKAVDFSARALDYQLRFDLLDVVIYNGQGVLMQLLDKPIPGWIVFSEKDRHGAGSDTLEYYRHEFETYYLAHAERGLHAVATDDPNWHADGTPHVDHNHLVIAIAGRLENGLLPAPGATPAFKLQLAAKM